MSWKVGSLSDPIDAQGLAHFLEVGIILKYSNSKLFIFSAFITSTCFSLERKNIQ